MDNLFLVVRKKDSVIVSIMRNKSNQTYSFVNLTKGHVCTCRFDTMEAAINDLEQEKAQGKVISYIPLVITSE